MINKGISKSLDDNKIFYLLSAIFIAIGVIMGIYCVKYLSANENESIAKYIDTVLKGSSGEIRNASVFFEALKNNMMFLLAYLFLGITVVGIPIILIINIIKGFTIGFSFSFFISKVSEKGIRLAIFAMIPQNIIYISCITAASAIAMKYSINRIKRKGTVCDLSIKKYIGNMIVFTGIIILGAIFESFLSPFLIKVILK